MTAQRIYSLIDDLIRDLDNAPSFRTFSAPALSASLAADDSKEQSQQPKGRQKKKKKVKKKKDKKPQQQKQTKTQKASKRGKNITKSQLPPPTLKNGVKSTLLEPMQPTYDPLQVESLWDAWWEERGYYAAKTNAEKTDPKQKNFVMVIPPPNVTGSLHLGHALMATIEDTITRYWRMKGRNCLWLPGTDHAGIATQTVVERQLARSGQTRHDLGRDAFIERVWQWKKQKGGRICDQLRKLGCSVDWKREVFTMDDKLSRAVTEAFVRLHAKGLIYRDDRLCHWSCSLQSAISDVEIDKIEISKKTFLEVPGYAKRVAFGIIHKFGYRVVDSEEIIEVATTRLETMLGDSAVAVHPDDERYKHLHGKFVRHPFVPDRRMPIVCDAELVDMTFGTGCVKITPAHDHNDFECGKRHNLAFINCLNEDGTINACAGERFSGKKRYDVRRELIDALTELGLFYGEEANPMVLDVCSRSKDIIEPLIKPQWYMDCDALAQRAMDAVFKDKTLTLLPQKEAEQQWTYFLGNIRKWCISRQLWWGHRVPAWRVVFDDGAQPADWDSTDAKLNWIVARSESEAQTLAAQRLPSACAGKYTLAQDEDVLDTWFSSGLFPFSTMGWPEQTADLESFFPGDLLETGGDIIFFWVARMVMMSLALMDTLPFSTVYLHPMVRDEHGAKMSKSSGNVLDPLHIIGGCELQTLIAELHGGNIREDKIAKFEKIKRKKFEDGIAPCGADALRFGLSTLLVQRSINLNVNTVIGYRLFCNKIWNATGFTLKYLEEAHEEKSSATAPSRVDFAYRCNFKAANAKTLSMADQWLLSRLDYCVTSCEASNAQYDFGLSTQSIYQFFYHEFCPIYLEAIKPIMWKNDDGQPDTAEQAQQKALVREILYIALLTSFSLMHPFMPFLSEELFQRLKRARYGESYKFGDEALIVAAYPDQAVPGWRNPRVEEGMALAVQLKAAIMSTKQASLGLSTKTRYAVFLQSTTGKNDELIELMAHDICTLSQSESVRKFDAAKQSEADYFVSSFEVFATVEAEAGGDDEKQSYAKKECVDTIRIFSDVRGVVKTEQRVAKFKKEMGKLDKLIEKAQKSLAKITKEDVRRKQQEKMRAYTEKRDGFQRDCQQLEKLSS